MKSKILFLAVIALSITACDDWLDVSPKALLAPPTFYSSENELSTACNAFYGSLSADKVFQEQSDLIASQNTAVEIAGIRTVPNSGDGWDFSYIRQFNTFIEYAENCSDENVKEKYVAVARFFRAYNYANLVARYGDVPWYDKQLSSDDPDLYKARDSRELVMQNVIADLDFAISKLGTTRDVYKVTKWTALLVKSRVCLFEGTFRKYHSLNLDGHDYSWYINEAANAALDFIQNSGYTIYTGDGESHSYEYLFASNDAKASEIVLARDYNNSLNVLHNASGFILTTSYGLPGMTKRLAAQYLMKDGSRFTDKANWNTMEFYEECQDRDPRLAQSIRTPGYVRIGGTETVSPQFNLCVTGYEPIKYLMDTTLGGDLQNRSYNDLPIFRAAEVYLNYAEAKAELGTLTQSDIDLTIKKLRDRVGMPNLDMAQANANPDPYLSSPETGYQNVSGQNKGVILEIRRERAVELYDENLRYNDIMRWKEGQAFTKPIEGMYFPGVGEYDVDKNGTIDICIYDGDKPTTSAAVICKLNKDIFLSNGTSGNIVINGNTTRKWDESKDYLYPIPTNELTLNENLKQNPGW